MGAIVRYAYGHPETWPVTFTRRETIQTVPTGIGPEGMGGTWLRTVVSARLTFGQPVERRPVTGAVGDIVCPACGKTCKVYRDGRRTILHHVNVNGERQTCDGAIEGIPDMGPLRVASPFWGQSGKPTAPRGRVPSRYQRDWGGHDSYDDYKREKRRNTKLSWGSDTAADFLGE